MFYDLYQSVSGYERLSVERQKEKTVLAPSGRMVAHYACKENVHEKYRLEKQNY